MRGARAARAGREQSGTPPLRSAASRLGSRTPSPRARAQRRGSSPELRPFVPRRPAPGLGASRTRVSFVERPSAPSIKADVRADRMESMLQQLLDREAERSLPPVRKPLLAAFVGALRHYGASVRPLVRAVRLVDQAPTEDAAAAVLEPLARKTLEAPFLSDEQLMQSVMQPAFSPSWPHGGHGLAGVSSAQPSLVRPFASETGAGSLRASRVAGRAQAHGGGGPPEICFRCGQGGHRNLQCNSTVDRNGQPIPDGQLVLFAPATWKERWGYDASGRPLRT